MRIRLVAIVNPAQAAHTYEELIKDSKATLLKYVSVQGQGHH